MVLFYCYYRDIIDYHDNFPDSYRAAIFTAYSRIGFSRGLNVFFAYAKNCIRFKLNMQNTFYFTLI